MPDPHKHRALFFGGEMVKAKAKAKKPAVKKSAPRVDSKAKSAEEIQKVRNQVTNLILSSSEEMAARVVQSVTEGGQVAALKYLWEMSGLFPFETQGENGEADSLAKILLERMGLQGKTPVSTTEEEGDESDEKANQSD